jgi:hypothetical protein
MDTQKRTQGAIPLGLSLTLWTISGLITVSLFFDLAGNSLFRQVVATLWSTGLEGTKVVSWRKGGKYRVLSFGLIALTLFSSLGVALSAVENQVVVAGAQAIESDSRYQDHLRAISSLNEEITVLTRRLGALPPDYITAAANLTKSIEADRDRLSKAEQDMAVSNTAIPVVRGTFEHLAAVLHVERKLLETLIILVVAALTEASAMVMASLSRAATQGAVFTGRRPSHPKSSAHRLASPIGRDPSPNDYLKEALDHPQAPKLLGRLAVAKRLGIGENQARSLLSDLVKSGQVKRASKSFVLVESPKFKEPQGRRGSV